MIVAGLQSWTPVHKNQDKEKFIKKSFMLLPFSIPFFQTPPSYNQVTLANKTAFLKFSELQLTRK